VGQAAGCPGSLLLFLCLLAKRKIFEVPTLVECESCQHFAKEHRWKNAVESNSADRSSRTRSVAGSSALRRSRQIGRTVKIPTLPE
jgi:hypothetical protein